jgi:hypothetical protein
MIKLPPSPSKAKRARAAGNETPILRAILDAFSHLDYVNAWRNNVGKLRDDTGRLVTYGLCVGSSDIVGVVKVECWTGATGPLGRFFALEVKRPGKTPTDDQLRFLDVVRAAGGAAAWVDNLDAAVAFIGRARDPWHDR